MPSPRIENGLIGVEKYPFLGKKYEKDNPKSCAVVTNELRRNALPKNTFENDLFMSAKGNVFGFEMVCYFALKSEKIIC